MHSRYRPLGNVATGSVWRGGGSSIRKGAPTPPPHPSLQPTQAAPLLPPGSFWNPDGPRRMVLALVTDPASPLLQTLPWLPAVLRIKVQILKAALKTCLWLGLALPAAPSTGSLCLLHASCFDHHSCLHPNLPRGGNSLQHDSQRVCSL